MSPVQTETLDRATWEAELADFWDDFQTLSALDYGDEVPEEMEKKLDDNELLQRRSQMFQLDEFRDAVSIMFMGATWEEALQVSSHKKMEGDQEISDKYFNFVMFGSQSDEVKAAAEKNKGVMSVLIGKPGHWLKETYENFEARGAHHTLLYAMQRAMSNIAFISALVLMACDDSLWFPAFIASIKMPNHSGICDQACIAVVDRIRPLL